MSTTFLTHNKVELALHTLRAADGPNLLLLHGLGEASPDAVPRFAQCWPGAVHALDFTGHGASGLPIGGGYTAEMLLADADMAVRELGHVTVVGRGLGAYIGLLIGGARATAVRGVVLADGPGMSGGPTSPTSQPVVTADAVDSTPDPYAILELGRDLRPPDYATTFVRLANEGSGLDEPITVTAKFRPRWLRAVVDEPGVREMSSLTDALARYA
ncbi:MAG: alpha/beta hydrolase [Ilumatobacter fluminis]|uniref:alpha/beta fold hydrolase n=1 Tax=Ilumatobacter fluminis TaxID=467091 RepID=UPI0032F024D6